MTDSRLSFTARAIILLLGLSLLVMLGVTIKERVSNPHLVTERPTAPQGMGQEQNLLASLMQKVAAEPEGGAQTDPQAVYRALDELLAKELASLSKMSGKALAEARYKKFRMMGANALRKERL